LVEIRNLSGNHHSLKAPCIINSQNVWSGSKRMDPHFHKAQNK